MKAAAMHWYLEETEQAATTLISLIASQRDLLGKAREEVSLAAQQHEVLCRDFTTSELQEDFDDHQVMAKFQRAGATGEHYAASKSKLESLIVRFEARASSFAVLNGALLQIAKQAIS